MRERIIEVASTRFVERGFDGVSMREIADECGISKAALYYHFTGKAELLQAVVSGYLGEVAAVISVVTNDPSIGEAEAKLRMIVRGLFELPAQRRAILRLAMYEVRQLPNAAQGAFIADYRTTFLAPLTGIFTSGVEAGELRQLDPDFCVRVLLGVLYPFFVPGGPAAGGAGEVDSLLDVLFGGFRA